MSLLSCEKLSFEYNGKTVFKDISFSIDAGDYLCIVGKNGSGKTTLINGMLGILKPQNGMCSFNKDIDKKDIGYLPQKVSIPKNFPASVYEVVISGCSSMLKSFPFYRKRERDIAKRNMELLKITDIKNKSFHDLSGGQQQRVLLARALCSAKKVLILDEPVSGLDSLSANSLYNTINHLNKEHNITIIMISHDLNNIFENATHILHIENNSYFFGTKDDYVNSAFPKKLIGGTEND